MDHKFTVVRLYITTASAAAALRTRESPLSGITCQPTHTGNYERTYLLSTTGLKERLIASCRGSALVTRSGTVENTHQAVRRQCLLILPPTSNIEW